MRRLRIMDSTNGASEAAPAESQPQCFGDPEQVCPKDEKGSSILRTSACPALFSNRVCEPPSKNRICCLPRVPAPGRVQGWWHPKAVVCAKTEALVSIVSSPADLQPTLMAREATTKHQIPPDPPFVNGGRGDLIRAFQESVQTDHHAQGALGDFVLALPVFEGLHHLHPDLRLDFWTNLNHAALVATRPYFGEAHSADGPELPLISMMRSGKEAAAPAFFQNAHAILVFGQARARTLADRLSKRLSSRVAWIQSFPDATRHEPVSRFLVRQVQQAGWPIVETIPRLNPASAEKDFVKKWFQENGWVEPPVVVHPGSGGVRKMWPLQRWWGLLRWLRCRQQAPVVMVMGPADGCLKTLAGEAGSWG